MKKETVSRFSVSLPPSLLRQLDEMSGEKGYTNRSTHLP
jgi:metal-responsive CopG/Arc/MetJ family transcriptional regulator